jgi:hypothetical protein
MWTTENTEGFTQAELNLINEAIEIVMQKAGDVEAYSVDDAINNAWADQTTAAALANDALQLLQ